MFAQVSTLTELATRLGTRPASTLRVRPKGLVPVPASWVELFTDGGIPRGATVSVSSLGVATALLSTATAAGLWGAVVGAPELSAAAAANAGAALARCVFVTPGLELTAAVGVLLEGVDMVLIGEPAKLPAVATRQLVARARVHGAVVVGIGRWPGVDLRVRITAATWSGLHAGYGQLMSRRVRLSVDGRRVPVARHAELDWPLDGRA